MSTTQIEMDWIADGACKDQASIDFFAENTSAYGRAQQKLALSVCQNCSVLGDCRTYALKYERFGIWGGMTEKQRSRERKRLNLATELDRYNLHTFLKRPSMPNRNPNGPQTF